MSGAVSRTPLWLILAVASGACAAINGVFAKLTTTALTSSWSEALAHFLSLSPDNVYINFALRAFFFGLNIAFNILMWTLFTAALTRGDSTTRVSIINVSSNFMVTALLGAMIFSEKLSGRWWIGAALLAVGNVIIGRRDEGEKKGKKKNTADADATAPEGLRTSIEEEQEPFLARNDQEEAEAADIIDLGDEELVGQPTGKKRSD